MSDSAAREAAVDPARSFLVEAPAGSGKTELLIQRYLALLARVEQPEQVVAITFTRKAAAEMRRRVQIALRAAAAGQRGTHAHEETTFDLARAVVARDEQLDWALLGQPQRLRVDTLDAFNIWLARQLPVLADGVAAAAIVEKPEMQYREAARRTVAGVLEGESALAKSLRTLLRGVDNDFEQLERLLAALLPRRDRWLPVLAGARPDELRALLEGALERLVDDELDAAADALPASVVAELVPQLKHAAEHAGEGLRPALAPWLALETAPRRGELALAAWRGIASLLLTKSGDWRRRIAKPEGFGPEHAVLGGRLKALLATLASDDALRGVLRGVAGLPDARYTSSQWTSLSALRDVLIRLAAELKVTFAEQNAVDFVELALAAQRALGHFDAPSELLLALDRRIQHILVDEFQDTSQSQLKLLELLTAGWQPGDGRTLFLVGDPMQSIYRFRDADMSLFLRAKQRGIGNVALESLTLTRNFRSAPRIVEWVNGVFARVFPSVDSLAAGAAAFRASEAVREDLAGAGVRLSPTVPPTARNEIERVVALLAEERERDPEQSIAVLVQSRSHLEDLRARLRARGWPVHAVEIDSLTEQQIAQDLAGLTRALLHRADRIAWLAVLRAPWCGLTWTDLEVLVGDARQDAIESLLKDASRLERLTADGKARVETVARRLDSAFARRDGLSLAGWVERTWRELGGEHCLGDPSDRLAAEQFFALLGSIERRGDLDDPAALHTQLEIVQPQADPPRERGIEIMTMHRAKGLEFDTVVLLGLAREPRPDEAKALEWMTRVAADGRDDLLIVPSAVADDTEGARLVAFVQRAERERDAAERARLLYVAATRARERLHLVWQLPPEKVRPPSNAMLSFLWSALDLEHATAPAAPIAPPTAAPDALATLDAELRRLADPTDAGGDSPPEQPPAPLRPEFAWAGHAAVHVGTVVHRYLQRIAEQGLSRWTNETVEALRDAFSSELMLLGVDPTELDAATARVIEALRRVIEDPLGRWVLGPHDDARSELRLALRRGDTLEHLRLDRTFVDGGQRWIIDYKTSAHEGGDVRAFLDSEVERYAPQLERYARAMATIDGRSARVGLYFPLLGELRDWGVPTASP